MKRKRLFGLSILLTIAVSLNQLRSSNPETTVIVVFVQTDVYDHRRETIPLEEEDDCTCFDGVRGDGSSIDPSETYCNMRVRAGNRLWQCTARGWELLDTTR